MNPLASTTGVLVLGLLVLQIQIQPGAAQVSKSLQDEVDLNRPKCEALLDDAYATFEKSGESGMVRQLYRDYLAVPTGPFVWCSDVKAPEGKDMVIVTGPLVSPGTTLEELMTHDDNTDEQRRLVYEIWDEHVVNATDRCCGQKFDWYGYFDQEESNDGTIDANEDEKVPSTVHTAVMVSQSVICTCTMTGVPPTRNNTMASVVNAQLEAAQEQNGATGLGLAGAMAALALALA